MAFLDISGSEIQINPWLLYSISKWLDDCLVHLSFRALSLAIEEEWARHLSCYMFGEFLHTCVTEPFLSSSRFLSASSPLATDVSILCEYYHSS